MFATPHRFKTDLLSYPRNLKCTLRVSANAACECQAKFHRDSPSRPCGILQTAPMHNPKLSHRSPPVVQLLGKPGAATSGLASYPYNETSVNPLDDYFSRSVRKRC